METSNSKKQIREINLILSVDQGAAVTAVNDIHPAITAAASCRVAPVENPEKVQQVTIYSHN